MNNIEFNFLKLFPNGLNDEQWHTLGKKHNMKKVYEIYDTTLNEKNMLKLIKNKKYKTICEEATNIIKKATIVSVFEKIAFQNFIANEPIHKEFSERLYDLLYNFNEESFENMVETLLTYKGNKNSNPCKWPVITAFLALKYPDREVFVKPTTVKANAKMLKVNIEYKSKPNFATYNNIKNMVIDFKKSSTLCKNENLMIVQAVLFCVAMETME